MGAATKAPPHSHSSPMKMKSNSKKQKTTTTTTSTTTKTTKETCPSFRRGHIPSAKDVKRLRTLSLPHVGSFDYFLDHGLEAGIADIVPFELDLVNPKAVQQDNVVAADSREVDTIKMWLENVKISKPMKSDRQNSSYLAAKSSGRLIPRECRELGLMYSGAITGEFCYQLNHRKVDANGTMTEIAGKVVKLNKKFGEMPIMVMSKACHLNGTKPDQLVKMREEVGFIYSFWLGFTFI